MVDWSAANAPQTGKDSIWYVLLSRSPRGLSIAAEGNPSTRLAAQTEIHQLLARQKAARRRTLVGCDFPYGYPEGVATALGVRGPGWRGIWSELRRRLVDTSSNANNRFEIAADLNHLLTAEAAPFWGAPTNKTGALLSAKKPAFGRYPEFRRCERRTPGAKSVWQLYGNGAVGSQALTGIPALAAWRDDPELADVSLVWPFETGFHLPSGGWLVLHAEIYPALVKFAPDSTRVKDQQQVEDLTRYFAGLDENGQLAQLFQAPSGLAEAERNAVETEEGWILGVYQTAARTSFQRGLMFPNEGFVQQVLEAHFIGAGYQLLHEGHVDLACVHPVSQDRWVIEVKGDSKNVGIDFNTGLGQLLKRMDGRGPARFGLAMPDTPAFRRQVTEIGEGIRRVLNLHWLWVDAQGKVASIEPPAV